jgi:hypothetical protein
VPYYVDLQSDGMGGYEFAFFSLPDQFDKLTGDEVNGYMYRLECRHQFEIEHQAYHAPTCTEKGCAEYWRCTGCGTYFQDAALENPHPAVLNPAGVYKPILGALGHNAGQLGMAILISGTTTMIWYAPVLIVAAVVTGAFTGYLTQILLGHMDKLKKAV